MYVKSITSPPRRAPGYLSFLFALLISNQHLADDGKVKEQAKKKKREMN